jgi:hypothetical protein
MRLEIWLREPDQSYARRAIHLPAPESQNSGGDAEERRQAG